MPVASLQASTVAPSLLEFPSDGSLLMPEVPDSDEEDVENDSEKDDVRSPSPKKRKSSAPTNTASKRTRRTRQSSNPTVNTKIPRKRPRSPVATQPSSAHKRKQWWPIYYFSNQPTSCNIPPPILHTSPLSHQNYIYQYSFFSTFIFFRSLQLNP